VEYVVAVQTAMMAMTAIVTLAVFFVDLVALRLSANLFDLTIPAAQQC
jgi:hypothetical protein